MNLFLPTKLYVGISDPSISTKTRPRLGLYLDHCSYSCLRQKRISVHTHTYTYLHIHVQA